jgi:hypothetical protein
VRINDKALEEFIKLYAEESGETLPVDEAREVASNLLEIYLLLLQPTPKERAAMEDPKL